METEIFKQDQYKYLHSNYNSFKIRDIKVEKVKVISFFLAVFFFIANCGGSAVQPLTRENNRKLLENPPQNQEQLQTGTFYGCVHVPATDFIQRIMLGFERTGETCSVTVAEDNTVEVSFLEEIVIPVVSTSNSQYRTDIFIGELANNQVLIVQHHQGEVVSVTQTIYDKNDVVVYGKSGQGDSIKECHFGMTTSERLAGKKNCGK